MDTRTGPAGRARREPAGGDVGSDVGNGDATLRLLVSMHRVIRHLRRTAVGSSTSLHPTQLIVLLLLTDAPSLRVGEIANQVPCSQPTATTVVSGLAADGLVERTPDEADGRATKIALTGAGRDLLRSLAFDQAEALAGLLTRLEPADRRLVLDAGEVLAKVAAGVTG